MSHGLGPRTDALWNLDLMKDHEGPKDCSSVAVCYKIAYDQNCIVLFSRALSRVFHIHVVWLPCMPVKRLKLDMFGFIGVSAGVFASTKVGCMKIILACTVNTLYSYL